MRSTARSKTYDRRLKILRSTQFRPVASGLTICRQAFQALTRTVQTYRLVETPELGRLEPYRPPASVGLATSVPRDSGHTHRKRSIRGRALRIRQALMPFALNAIRLNPEFKAKYEAMVKVGKSKVAIAWRS